MDSTTFYFQPKRNQIELHGSNYLNLNQKIKIIPRVRRAETMNYGLKEKMRLRSWVRDYCEASQANGGVEHDDQKDASGGENSLINKIG